METNDTTTHVARAFDAAIHWGERIQRGEPPEPGCADMSFMRHPDQFGPGLLMAYTFEPPDTGALPADTSVHPELLRRQRLAWCLGLAMHTAKHLACFAGGQHKDAVDQRLACLSQAAAQLSHTPVNRTMPAPIEAAEDLAIELRRALMVLIEQRMPARVTWSLRRRDVPEFA